MSRAVWTALAELELEEILFYIRVEDGRPETARRIGKLLHDHVDRHAAGSLPGHSHPAAPSDWRYLQCSRWLIFYQPHRDGIEIMRVIDSARDLPTLLDR